MATYFLLFFLSGRKTAVFMLSLIVKKYKTQPRAHAWVFRKYFAGTAPAGSGGAKHYIVLKNMIYTYNNA
jgi:hypothetical protein